ncbi:hypothetical protein [Dactylosporangium sp. CA-139066]|uniref:hypothetical protein n=1 Tax=Dactylosporangium sp. CA-139066 TaxID=3239930 RepID=UPI003D92885F
MRPAIVAALGSAVLFEALTVLATHDKSIRAVSPWQDDPYDVLVSFALFAVPMLAAAIALWRAPGAADRAAAALTALVGLTVAAEWAAVAVRAHAEAWNRWTAVLVGGLAVQSLLTLTAGVRLWRHRSPHATTGDGLEYVAGRLVPPAGLAWIRAHTSAVFVTLSLLAAAAMVGAQAVGEGWTDPLLIGWAFTVSATSNYAFCVVSNAVAGFITRPPITRAERIVIAGTLGLLLTTAFRDPLWTAVTGGPVTTVPVLVTLTAGAGLAAAALTAAALAARPNGGSR